VEEELRSNPRIQLSFDLRNPGLQEQSLRCSVMLETVLKEDPR